jgi:hypothetical protein
LTTEKTGERVVIPIESELEETLRAGPCGEMSFIAADDGKPMKKESFGNWFRDACRAAGIKKSAHGLRKAGATRDVNRGWSEARTGGEIRLARRSYGGALHPQHEPRAARNTGG